MWTVLAPVGDGHPLHLHTMKVQNSETAQDIHDSGSSVERHHTVTRSGRVVRRPDYYGVSGNT